MKVFIAFISLSIIGVAFCGFGGLSEANGFMEHMDKLQKGVSASESLQCSYNSTVLTNIFHRSTFFCVFQWISLSQLNNVENNINAGQAASLCLYFSSGVETSCLENTYESIKACPNADYVPESGEDTPIEELGKFLGCVFENVPAFMNCTYNQQCNA